MNPMQGQSQFSDEDLRKLAQLLKQMPADEGIATVTPTEEDYMKDVFKSGKPLAGTQGLGPGGGDVLSFNGGDEGSWDVGGSASYGGAGQTGGTGDSSGAAGQTPSATSSGSSWDPGAGSSGGGGSATGSGPGPGASGGGQPLADRGQFETRPEVIQARNTPEGRAGDWTGHLEGGGDSGGGQGEPDPPPPPKFKDMNGKEWNTQAEADASNERIRAAMGAIEGQVLTSDTTFQRWTARNKDKHPDLTAEQIETAYNTARTKSLEDASAQLPRMVENMNNYLKDAGAGTTYETWK